MEKRHQLEVFEGMGRLEWEGHSLAVRYDVSVNQYGELTPGGGETPTSRSMEARIEAADQQLLAQANGRDDLVLQLEDGRRFPCVMYEQQGGAGWLEGSGEVLDRAMAAGSSESPRGAASDTPRIPS